MILRKNVGKFRENSRGKIQKTRIEIPRKTRNDKSGIFAKISVSAIFIFAILFGFWLNFANKNQNLANAIDENSAQNSGSNSANYETKKLDFIQFNGASWVDTKIDQLGDVKVSADFQIDELENLWIFGARNYGGDSAIEFFAETNNATPYWRANRGNVWRRIVGFENEPALTPDTARHEITLDDGRGEIYFDGKIATTFYIGGALPPADFTPPTVAKNIFIGTSSGGGNAAAGDDKPNGSNFVGKIYSFQIYKDDVLVLNLIPAARFLCGENSEIEYGFVNDLNEDGNLTNDEFFGNSGTGILSGSEEISAEKCAENLPENPNENLQNDLENNSQNSGEIFAPNTGIFSRN